MKRVAFYGGSFDPVHNGHLSIGRVLLEEFALDEFVFLPAFHAPHKLRKTPTSAYDRHAMLCLVTQADERLMVSKMEIEMPERPFTVETLGRLNKERPDDEIFFVMGADSWMEITAWREWEKVLRMANHIVVTRPGFEIGFEHVYEDIRNRIVKRNVKRPSGEDTGIYISDAVNLNISATEIRRKIRENNATWRDDVPSGVANYIEKYQIYS